MRPRFGPGPRTAVWTGLAMWFLYGLLHAVGEAPMGLFPTRMYVIGTVIALIQYPLATVLGAKFYTEA
ncbi:MAG TPA: hypothetical protein VNI61_12550 [Gemmatimonadales bacterium]|nr:hypothetical protein [Gemmatimonadales bacterium]